MVFNLLNYFLFLILWFWIQRLQPFNPGVRPVSLQLAAVCHWPTELSLKTLPRGGAAEVQLSTLLFAGNITGGGFHAGFLRPASSGHWRNCNSRSISAVNVFKTFQEQFKNTLRQLKQKENYGACFYKAEKWNKIKVRFSSTIICRIIWISLHIFPYIFHDLFN